MKTLVTHLRNPFRFLNILAGGTSAYIFIVSVDIVVKVPVQFDNPTPDLQVLANDVVKSVEHEKNVYKLLAEKSHPNTVQCFLCTMDGIFLQRMEESLRTRLERRNERPITDLTQHKNLINISATVWLEQLNCFHGDIRPANILLCEGHVKLSDFGNTTEKGKRLPGTSSPFYRPTADCESPLAGPASEQFAIGSCIYNIRTGHEPLDHLDGPEMVQALIRGDFPSIATDSIFSQIIYNCWHGNYKTMSHVERAIKSALPGCECEKGANVMESKMYAAGVVSCQEFLKREGKLLELEEQTS